MTDPRKPEPPKPASESRLTSPGGPEEAMVCERCGSSQVYRMHAVWRCADCGYKTDCCGW